MPGIRTFISIVPPPPVRELLAGLATCLRGSRADVRWEDPEKFHITLKFLGDVAAGEIDALTRAVESAAAPFRPFPLVYRNVGAFPDVRRPRVVWAGCDDMDGTLARLERAVDEAARPFVPPGGGGEEKFHPHITLGRVRTGGVYLTPMLEKCTFEPLQTLVDGIFVMKSMLTPQGALHSVVRSIHLHSF